MEVTQLIFKKPTLQESLDCFNLWNTLDPTAIPVRPEVLTKYMEVLGMFVPMEAPTFIISGEKFIPTESINNIYWSKPDKHSNAYIHIITEDVYENDELIFTADDTDTVNAKQALIDEYKNSVVFPIPKVLWDFFIQEDKDVLFAHLPEPDEII